MERLRILKYCALAVALTMGSCSLSMDTDYIKIVYGDYNSSDEESDDSGFYTSIYDINDVNVYHNYVDENNSDINIYNHISDQTGLAFNDFTSNQEERFEFKKWWLRGPKAVLNLDDIREYMPLMTKSPAS